jgi:hypothetical protein
VHNFGTYCTYARHRQEYSKHISSREYHMTVKCESIIYNGETAIHIHKPIIAASPVAIAAITDTADYC